MAWPPHCTCLDSPVTRIVRVIGQPRGNMLLVGIGGSGRQSLARLASSICEYITFQIEVTKHYRKQEFREGIAGLLGWGVEVMGVFGGRSEVSCLTSCGDLNRERGGPE